MLIYSLVGKGGVGKTLSASLLATLAAKKGKTLVISLDPAHNLGDTLGVDLGSAPTKICDNLYAAEPNVEEEIKSFSKKVAKELESHYKYLKVFNLDKMLKTIEFMPGVEEQVIFDLLTRYSELDYDYLIVDHPPTGLALRILLYAKIMLGWVEKLTELRKEIVKRREMLLNLSGKKAEIKDPVLDILKSEINRLRRMDQLLGNSSTHRIGLVVNPEELPVLEASRAKQVLEKFNMPVTFLMVNKMAPEGNELRKYQEEWIRKIDEMFRDLKVYKLPLVMPPPKGIERLKEFSERFVGELP